MSKVAIILRKSLRTKLVSGRLADALVNLGLARYDGVANVRLSPVIPVPPPAPLTAPAADIPPEAAAAADKVDGVVVTPESVATDQAAPANAGAATPIPEPIEQQSGATPPPESESVDTRGRRSRGRNR